MGCYLSLNSQAIRTLALPYGVNIHRSGGAMFELQTFEKITHHLVFTDAIVFMIRFAEKGT